MNLLGGRAIGTNSSQAGSKKVLILGSGFSGTYVLRHMVRRLKKHENVEITMVSNENFFLFSPLLHEVAMGAIETRHIAYPIRRQRWTNKFKFIRTSVEKIDIKNRQVTTGAGTLNFDYLVLALGSVSDVSQLRSPGHGVFTLKSLRDAMLLRNHVISLFEQASMEESPERQKQLLTFIVSGGGYTGVQTVTELRDFIFRSLLRYYRTINPSSIRIILVEAERNILLELHSKLRDYTLKHLQSMKIELRLQSRVTRVWEEGVEINDTEIVPTRTIIWGTGVVANPRIAELDLEKDSIGRVLVNKHLAVTGVPGVYALGDCAHYKDPSSGRPAPPRAHIAVRQAKIVAYNVLAEIRGERNKPYRYTNSSEIVSLGNSKAVFRFHNFRLYGFPARLIWLASYSLLVMGKYNRTRIIIDWLLTRVFGRDITLLRLSNDL